MWSIQRICGVIAGLFLVLALAAAPFVNAQVPAQLKWEKAAPFPEPEGELYGAAANGKMYVFGGYGPGTAGNPVGMVWEYDPTTDKFTKKKQMPIPAHHAAVASYGGKLYLFGGFTLYTDPNRPVGGWAPVTNTWEYNPATDSWKALAPLPSKRGSAVAMVAGDLIYVIGGATVTQGSKDPALFANGPARSVNTNEAYNPKTNTWVEKSPMPTPRNHMYAGVVNGKIYLMGGRIPAPFMSAASNVDIVEEYDTATDQWGPRRASMLEPRSGGGFATYNGKIYVAGGEVQTSMLVGAYRALEAYDPASNTWSILPSLPAARHGMATAFLGNKLHLISGKVTSGGTSPGTELHTTEHDVLEIPRN